jgi:hypothetical protein
MKYEWNKVFNISIIIYSLRVLGSEFRKIKTSQINEESIYNCKSDSEALMLIHQLLINTICFAHAEDVNVWWVKAL